jgi:hypothetical protein
MASSMTSTSVCPRCSSPLAEIHLDQAGRTMVMRSCSTCDSRWWERDGEQVALGAVLDTVASSKRVAAENKLAAAAAR